MKMLMAVLLVVTLLVATPLAQARWVVDPTGSNTSVEGRGGGLIYSCASGAPSRGAVAVVVQGVESTGRYGGTLEVGNTTLRTTWQCAALFGYSTCFVGVPDDVPRARDMLIRGSRVSASVLGKTVVASLRGSSDGISTVRSMCR